jgi:predicted permease
VTTFLQDLKFAIRVLAKSPGFTVIAILTLALGIGANTAIFSVVNAVLLRPLDYKDSSSLVNVWGKYDKENIPQNWISEPELWDLRDRNQSFSDLAAFRLGDSENLTSSEAPPVQVSAAAATYNLFPLLGARTVIGRTFTADEDQPGRNREVLLSYALWHSQFGGDLGIVGKSMQLGGESYAVVGVLTKDFSLSGKQDLWLPLALNRAKQDDRGSHAFHVVARLKPGVGFAQASADMTRFAEQLAHEYPDNYGSDSGWGMYLVPVKEQLVRNVRPALLLLMGAVAFVLLIACANVANLFLARASSREKEFAVRAAMGAGRARLIRQLLTESIVLAFIGGVIGLVIAYWGVDALRALVPEGFPRAGEVRVDPMVLGFTFAVSLLTGVIFGLAPAWHTTQTNLPETLRESGRGSSATGSSRRLRSVLVVSEIALAVLLLVGAGLLIRSFRNLLEVNPGFQPQHLLTMEVSLPEKAYPDATVQTFFERLMPQLRAIPGVQSAGAISEMPLSSAYSSGSVFMEQTTAQDVRRLAKVGNFPYFETDQRMATPGYFEAMGIQLVRGRLLEDADSSGTQLVAVVDTNFVKHFWPGEDPIGKRIAISVIPNSNPLVLQWRTVVGVVGHIKHYGLDTEGREQAYFPHAQAPFDTHDMYFAIRTSLDPASVTTAVREQVLALDKNLPIYNVSTMDGLLSSSLAEPRLNLVMLGVFASLALILAAIGVYGVMAYHVMQRTHEIGIRMALGAQPGDILRQVVIEGGRLGAIGLMIGVVVSLALTRSMASLLFNVAPSDPVTYVAVFVTIGCAALAACYIPARRATRVDPMVALRYE